jgi:hypothetical protein
MLTEFSKIMMKLEFFNIFAHLILNRIFELFGAKMHFTN